MIHLQCPMTRPTKHSILTYGHSVYFSGSRMSLSKANVSLGQKYSAIKTDDIREKTVWRLRSKWKINKKISNKQKDFIGMSRKIYEIHIIWEVDGTNTMKSHHAKFAHTIILRVVEMALRCSSRPVVPFARIHNSTSKCLRLYNTWDIWAFSRDNS